MVQATKFIIDPTYKIVLNDIGINVEELLIKTELPLDFFSQKDPSLTVEEYFRLWENVTEIVNDPLLSLHIGRSLTPEAFHPVIFAALCSPNLTMAFSRISKYKRLIGPMTVQVIEEKKSTSIIIDCLYRTNPIPKSLVAMEQTFFMNFTNTALRETIKPLSVITTSDLLLQEEFQDFFNIKPVLGEVNKITFSAEDANKPFVTENYQMWQFFEPELRRRLSDLTQEATYSDRVQSCLLELLPSGVSSSEEVAKRLAMSKRTLQRNLNNENTSFQHELNKTREKLSKHYLSNSNLSCEEISFLLGYDDPNSFVRAFRSWTGETPGKVRLGVQ